ncbi:hypothetical protein HYQ46_008001 [Verticillium longisporum]|nr:hypothetical protein HYQ46_008001 [Verticillium longisporum]
MGGIHLHFMQGLEARDEQLVLVSLDGSSHLLPLGIEHHPPQPLVANPVDPAPDNNRACRALHDLPLLPARLEPGPEQLCLPPRLVVFAAAPLRPAAATSPPRRLLGETQHLLRELGVPTPRGQGLGARRGQGIERVAQARRIAGERRRGGVALAAEAADWASSSDVSAAGAVSGAMG